MPNFGIAFAMPCTREKFNKNGGELQQFLMALGYNLKELQFYPNKPYIATNYKGHSDRISTSNTPRNDGRHVLHAWNIELFKALCSQRSDEGIVAGEYFTDQNGEVHLCEKFIGEHALKYFDEGVAYSASRDSSHKSTYYELVQHFENRYILDEEIAVKPKLKPGPKPKIKTEEAASHPSLIEAGKQIANCFKGKSVEEMQDTLSKIPACEKNGDWNDKLPDLERTLMGKPLPLNKEIIVQSKENYLVEGPDRGPYCDIIISDKMRLDIDAPIDPAPLTFQEILERFGEGKTVVYGQVLNDISCSPERHIVGVTKTQVDLEEEIISVDHSIIFASQADFLQYALQKISQS